MNGFAVTRTELPEETELRERNGRAVLYRARVARERARRSAAVDRAVRALLRAGVILLVLALMVRLVTPVCLL